MKVNSKYLETILKDWKYIFNTLGSKKHQDWLFFANDKIFAFNGYFYISTDFKSPVPFAISPSCISILDSAEVDLMWKENRSMVKSGNKKIEYDYPFDLQDKIREFYYDATPGTSLVPEDIDYIFNYVIAPKDSINYSNVYIKNGYMYATDSFRIIQQKTKCIDTVLPNGIHKIVNAPIRSIVDTDNGITLQFGDYTLSAVKTLGQAEEIIQFVGPLPKFKLVVPVEAIDILMQIKRFDFEHKKKDIQAVLEFNNNKLLIKAEGFKSAFEAELDCEFDTQFRLSANPDHLISCLQLTNEILYDPNMEYIVAQTEDINHYLRIGR